MLTRSQAPSLKKPSHRSARCALLVDRRRKWSGKSRDRSLCWHWNYVTHPSFVAVYVIDHVLLVWRGAAQASDQQNVEKKIRELIIPHNAILPKNMSREKYNIRSFLILPCATDGLLPGSACPAVDWRVSPTYTLLLSFIPRYSKNLHLARSVSIKRGFLTGLAFGSMMLAMFGMYGLAFWYGSTLVLAGTLKIGELLTAFFAVLVGAFSIAQVGCYQNISNIDDCIVCVTNVPSKLRGRAAGLETPRSTWEYTLLESIRLVALIHSLW